MHSKQTEREKKTRKNGRLSEWKRQHNQVNKQKGESDQIAKRRRDREFLERWTDGRERDVTRQGLQDWMDDGYLGNDVLLIL